MRRCRKADETIQRLAAQQHGVVSRSQLLEAGISADSVDRRAGAGGLLIRLHRGVYRVGPIEAGSTREMVAVLACDGKAVVSHQSAAGLRRIGSPPPREAPVDVIVASSGHGRRPGFRVHRLRGLRLDEFSDVDGIPATTAARTLLDLAATLADREVERMFAEAVARKVATEAEVRRLLRRHRYAAGRRRLLALLMAGDPALTRSQAEEILLAMTRRAGLPRPAVNSRVGGYEVDFVWARQRLIVEVDGFAYHAARDRFERDRARDARLAAAGYRVIRVTWKQLTEAPEVVLIRLALALGVNP